MNKRLETIYQSLAPCKKLADVGCDHGYIADAMLSRGKAERAVISDISAPSLKKAADLLERNHPGRYTAVVCDGLKGVDSDCDQVLIAGMGGEEIISILEGAPFVPERLVLQPMKNADKLRKRLLSLGYRILKDYLFIDVKYYNLIVCERGEDCYTEDEIFFGRDNLRQRPEDFIRFAEQEREKYAELLKSPDLSDRVRDELTRIKNKYEAILNEV